MMGSRQYICRCYFQRNIFLHDYKLHVTYRDEQQFKDDYKRTLDQRGCTDLSAMIEQVHKEIKRREENGRISSERKQEIERCYKPLHLSVYSLKEFYLSPSFLSIVEYCKQDNAVKTEVLKQLKSWKADQVYSLEVFTKEFCQLFLEELKNFEKSDMPKGRPNTMNVTGLLLEELGFYQNLVNPLREKYLNPIARILYPDWVGEGRLDSQRAFIVSYDNCDGVSKDNARDLALHFDNAEVTLNVSLSSGFEGGELFFGKLWKESTNTDYKRVDHTPSHGVFHRGRQMHGAMPLETGERYNLIIWMRSSSVRNKYCPMCERTPDLVPTLGEGDGFVAPEVPVCQLS
ncbi:2-oxoglutarate and iron-dependent oxygenase domain-containing protein 2-like [Clytia hemisphaerica]|uniref:Fe2OG dioxygenase domain-containing protein n=2 Tax=Clytia hemisphaerica TaxID=252671 RepID=A0A7M5TU68_9CNID